MARRLSRNSFLLALSFVGFAGLGLPDGVLGVAWPSIRATFALPLDALGALLIASTSGYVASSAASGKILERLSIGTLLALSCAATAFALIGYALAGAWAVIVALGVVAGLGAGAIDAGINLYVATHHSPRTLGLLHAGYGLGTTAGPLLMTSLLMAGSAWQTGYAVLAGAQASLALCFFPTRRLWPRARPTVVAPPAPLARTLRLPGVRLGGAAFFLYTGLEAAAGAWIYSLLRDARGGTLADSGAAVSAYWGGLMGGRVLLALLPASLDPRRVLGAALAALAAAAGLLALDLGRGVSAAAITALGLAAGPVFPLLMAATPRRVSDAHAASAVGISVAAAALGQSLIPAGVGLAAAHLGLEAIPRLLCAGAALLCGVHFALEQLAPAPAIDQRTIDSTFA